MKKLKDLQDVKVIRILPKLLKVGLVLSRVVFICALVSSCICATAMLLFPFGGSGWIHIEGLELHGLLSLIDKEVSEQAIIGIGCYLMVSLSHVVLAKYANTYFKKAVRRCNPFTMSAARDLMYLGLMTIGVPAFGGYVAGAFQDVMAKAFRVEVDYCFGVGVFAALGVGTLAMAFLCRYGAELSIGAQQDTLCEDK